MNGEEDRSLQPEELSSFLEEWKRELSSQRNHKPSKKIPQSSVYNSPHYPEHQLHYNEENPSSTVILGYKRGTPLLDDDNLTGPPKKQYHQSVDDQLTDLADKGKATIGGSSLFVLPGGAICIQASKNGERCDTAGGRERESCSENKTQRKVYASGTSLHNEEQLIDKLISDLNEIDSIPFFDIQLPKEIAILIFSYLSIQDLCHCSMVSHSWGILAEDNQLWIIKCHELGYSTETDSTGVHWKTVVKELILRKKRIQQNWKERICGISDYQPDSTGKLCCAVYHNKQIMTCYSYGECHLWSLSNEQDGPLTLSQTLPPNVYTATPTCAAISEGVACTGDAAGVLKVFDLEQNEQVYNSYSNSMGIHSVAIATNGIYHGLVFASGGLSPFSYLTFLSTSHDQLNEWIKIEMTLPTSAQLRNFQIKNVSLVSTSCESQVDQFLILYSTQTSLTLQSPQKSFKNATHLLTGAGDEGVSCIHCFTHSNNTVACGIFDCSWNQVKIYDLVTSTHKESYRGHYSKIQCVEFEKTQSNDQRTNGVRIISGGDDKRINLYDGSSSYPVMTLSGHTAPVLCVELDDWKVASGSRDGTVAIWDLRMGHELWTAQERHPVSLCKIDENYLVVSHVPSSISISNRGSPLHTRQRGLLRVYDFSIDPLFYTKTLPSICSSSYDEPSASFYNLNLIFPYDTIQH